MTNQNNIIQSKGIMELSLKCAGFLLIYGLSVTSKATEILEVPFFKLGEWEMASSTQINGQEPVDVPARLAGCIEPSTGIMRDFTGMKKNGCTIIFQGKNVTKYKYLISCGKPQTNGLHYPFPNEMHVTLDAPSMKSFTMTTTSEISSSRLVGSRVSDCKNAP